MSLLTLIVVLVVLAFVLFVIELFMPGIVLATIGGILLMAAVALAYTGFGVLAGTLLLVGSVFICCIGFFIWASTFDKTPFGKRMTLTSAVKAESDHPQYGDLLGKTGITLTPLRPSGAAMFGSRRVDVMADTGIIDKDERIYVISVDGMKIMVRKIEQPQFEPR